MKLIKFDLPINGIKVRNLDELRDNLTDEILVLARSSQLERWCRTRQLPEQAQAVAEAVKREGSDKGLFLALCEVLEVEAHPDDVKALFDSPPTLGRFLQGAHHFNEESLNLFNEKINYKTSTFTFGINNVESLGYSINSLVAEIYVSKWDRVKAGDLILFASSNSGEPLFECVSPISGFVRQAFFDFDNCVLPSDEYSSFEFGDFFITITQVSA